MKNEKLLIGAGVALFVIAGTFPVWHAVAAGKPGARPELDRPAGECVESRAEMTARHMDLLNRWRDAVVREGQKTYASKATGKEHEMSLTRTCLGCHADRQAFCDRCHDYSGVKPICWNCHVDSKGR